MGPTATEAFLANYNKKLPVEHITALTSMQGIVRKTTEQPMVLIKNFHTANKKFRRIDDKTEGAVEVTAPIIYNYAMLDELYKYSPNALNPYYSWYNTQKTVWDTVKREAAQGNRHHFVFIEVPSVLPSLSNLKAYSDKKNTAFLKIFDTPAKMMALELWKWIDPQMSSSTVIGDVPAAVASKICIVLTYEGRWCALGLNYLKSWVKGNVNDTHMNIQQYKADQLQKFYLKMMLSIQSNLAATDEALTLVDGVDPLIEKIGTDGTTQTETTTGTAIPPEADQPTGIPDGEVIPDNDTPEEIPVETQTTSRSEHEADQPIDEADVDQDLAAIDKIEQHVVAAKFKSSTPVDEEELDPPKILSPEEVGGLIYEERKSSDVLDAYLANVSESGSISASEYRTLDNSIAKTDKLKSPYSGTQTLAEYSAVTVADTAIHKEKNVFKDSETIQDKSMLESTLKTFDSDYIERLMPKHVVGMVENIKKAGIIVQDYKVEKDGDILGDYEMHTLTLRPVEGMPSTIRFKIPTVDHNGVFKCNGSNYRLRKLRSDLPIRKIGPTRVGLTSYYGKVSVTRADKKISDEAFWLSKKITLMGQNPDTGVRDVIPADMFNGNEDNPTTYSGLSKYFKSFTIAGNLFTFSKVEQTALFGEEMIAQLKAKQLTVIGRMADGRVIVIDNENIIAAMRQGEATTLGTIYTLLGLKQSDAPVEYSSLKVYSKFIPVGVILGYILGLDNLLSFLEVTPRVVEGRGQLKLANDEWALRFKDKSLVFSRKNKVATMILAGFGGYHKTISQYHYESFNNENVYLNLLTENGIGVRYFRELKLLDELFVDPITKTVLERMKEPTTFRGLLVRSTELLVTDKCPDNQDTLQARVKGYERFSGAVYGELVNSIRDFKSRNIRGKSRIEMSPYAVWKTITSDPANMAANEINPIESLKQIEAVTYAGNGGRAKDTMNKASRAYHENDIGYISEATSDSSDVGINMYMPPNPQFDDLLGMTHKTDITTVPNSALLSTAAMISPAADHDDGKRV